MSFVLFESASGYALFEKGEVQEIATLTDEIQNAIADFKSFSRVLKLKAFAPFASADNALENMNKVSEGILPDLLKNFLEQNLPKKKSSVTLGVIEPELGSSIQNELGVKIQRSGALGELCRGIRAHFTSYIKELRDGDLEKAQLGLGHSYSRSKVKFNIHRVDNMIIQSISLLDTLDKDVNTFSMRVREWYSWHFPELAKITSENLVFAKLVKLIREKSNITEELRPAILEIVNDEDKTQEIFDAARTSMGTDISKIDLASIEEFTEKVISLTEYRNKLHQYLIKKMNDCAPNLSALMGEMVGARLISRAGSLTNLAKYPASTVQILGAEKALFRALKTKGKTPKYGLIYHSTFIQKANAKNKGRISRYVANKASLASRIDSFSEYPTTIFGTKLREQVEERLSFYETGKTPRKNIDVMKQAMVEFANAQPEAMEAEAPSSEKKSKKRKKDDEDDEKESKKKKKKSKKSKESDSSSSSSSESESSSSEEDKKKKKKKSKKDKK
eukprot:TRINITY_DN875_c0_g1_i1.p1 TRINITY_DN875_c0_g1~~TRINITY_DN875_c0_g1_i1.p1  ORF type:complete len:513 (+),score=163.48 TRINITY_DN875_c0_g1_i1:28-1539(+)